MIGVSGPQCTVIDWGTRKYWRPPLPGSTATRVASERVVNVVGRDPTGVLVQLLGECFPGSNGGLFRLAHEMPEPRFRVV